MLGHKARDFRQHVSVSLDDLVPDDNFYRHVEDCIDLSFVRNLASDFYSDVGPSLHRSGSFLQATTHRIL